MNFRVVDLALNQAAKPWFHQYLDPPKTICGFVVSENVLRGQLPANLEFSWMLQNIIFRNILPCCSAPITDPWDQWIGKYTHTRPMGIRHGDKGSFFGMYV